VLVSLPALIPFWTSYPPFGKCPPNRIKLKKLGTGGAKMGNVHLKWAFSEAAVTFLRHNSEGKKILARLEKKHGKGKALSILAHKIGRAVYYMLSRGTLFSMEKFLAA
jgi:transposase